MRRRKGWMPRRRPLKELSIGHTVLLARFFSEIGLCGATSVGDFNVFKWRPSLRKAGVVPPASFNASREQERARRFLENWTADGWSEPSIGGVWKCTLMCGTAHAVDLGREGRTVCSLYWISRKSDFGEETEELADRTPAPALPWARAHADCRVVCFISSRSAARPS